MIYRVSKQNFFSDTRNYNDKKHIFQLQKKIQNKTTATTAIKNELNYSPMSEGHKCLAKINLEASPLR